MNGSCHCGAVTITLPGPPDYLNQCNCTVCHKLGTLWGYFPGDAVRFEGRPETYRRADAPAPKLEFGFCRTCGATTHWAYFDEPDARMGVNMRLFEPAELAGVGILYGDRRTGEQGERKFWREPSRFAGFGAAA